MGRTKAIKALIQEVQAAREEIADLKRQIETVGDWLRILLGQPTYPQYPQVPAPGISPAAEGIEFVWQPDTGPPVTITTSLGDEWTYLDGMAEMPDHVNIYGLPVASRYSIPA